MDWDAVDIEYTRFLMGEEFSTKIEEDEEVAGAVSFAVGAAQSAMEEFFANHPEENVENWFVHIKITAGMCWGGARDYDRDKKKLTICMCKGLNLNVSEMGDEGRTWSSLTHFFENKFQEYSQFRSKGSR